MSQPTIAAGFASALLDYAEQRGAERAGLLEASGLDAAELSDQDACVPVAAYRTLIAAGIAATGDTALLLRHTFESKLETISVVGQIVHSAQSLAHSIEQLNRYLRLMAEVDIAGHRDRFELHKDKGAVWIVDHIAVSGPEYIALEASFARFISEFRRSFPDEPFALEMEVTYPRPPHADEYPDLFRIPVRFGAARNALRIDPARLSEDSEFEPGHAYCFGIFTRHANALLAELGRSDRLRDQIEAAILPDLHEGSLSNSQRAWPLFAALLRDWSRKFGMAPFGMARVPWAEVAARIGIALGLAVGALGIGMAFRPGRRAPFARVTAGGAGLALILWPWLGAALGLVGLGLVTLAILPERRR